MALFAIICSLSTQDLIKDKVDTDPMIHQDIRLTVDILHRVSKTTIHPMSDGKETNCLH